MPSIAQHIKANIEIKGLRASQEAIEDGFTIVKILTPSKKVIGSVTIPNSAFETLPEEELARLIDARVNEALRAAIKEPSASN